MINKIHLIGNVGKDPETRQLENGTSVGRFSLATSDSYKDKDGNWQQTTEWHNIVVWKEQADRAQATIKKGAMVYVEGKVSYRKYNDKDGLEKSVTDIVCSSFRVLDKKDSVDQAQGINHGIPAAPPRPQAAPQQAQFSQGHPEDLPF